MNSNREHFKAYFLNWLEGRLDDEKKQKVESHLDKCESCDSYYRTMRNVIENPKPEQLPSLQKDPHLPVRIKNRAANENDTTEVSSPFFGLSKSLTGSLVMLGLLLGFLIGQQLVYIARDGQEAVQNTSISELYYESMVQPNLGVQFEKVLTEIEGDQQ
ncbi:MAG: zf-HC2 domain-containing protein [Balneolaceae bacterium]|nr:zf-HC2 domain-containing protein [Balneolaceae bacterium]